MKREGPRKFLLAIPLNITTFLHLVTVLLILAGFLLVRPLGAADCTTTTAGLIPLNDLAGGSYQGFPGGLYPGGNTVPESHLAVGLAAGQAVTLRDLQGVADPNGKIVVLSIGMSNAKIEFADFISVARLETPPGVVLINGADTRQDAPTIADPAAPYWAEIDSELVSRNLSPLQVQAVWMKQAIMREGGQFPADALELQGYLHDIVLILTDRYPNLKTIYFSSRAYGGYATSVVSQEPWAYQGGFAVKWLIEAQITGSDPTLAYENVPWLAWGAYLWADGETPRSDGMTWLCEDFVADGAHPSDSGSLKVATMLYNFFSTDPTTFWFRPSEPSTQTPTPTPTESGPPTATPTTTPSATPPSPSPTSTLPNPSPTKTPVVTPTSTPAAPSPTATTAPTQPPASTRPSNNTPTYTPSPALPTVTPTYTPSPSLPATTPTYTPSPALPTATPTRLPWPTKTPTRRAPMP